MPNAMNKDFTKQEILLLKKLKKEERMQQFIDSLKYNKRERISILDVLRKRTGDCLEAACFASYTFSLNGMHSFIIDLRSKGDDDDHIICIYKKNGLFGSVAQSKFLGLKSRNPVYKTVRELVMSYFDNYFDYNGVFDLKDMSVPFRIRKEWIHSAKAMEMIEDKIDRVKHIALVGARIRLPRVSRAKFKRELMIIPKDTKIHRKYR